MTKTIIANTKKKFFELMRKFVRDNADKTPILISAKYNEATKQWEANYKLTEKDK